MTYILRYLGRWQGLDVHFFIRFLKYSALRFYITERKKWPCWPPHARYNFVKYGTWTRWNHIQYICESYLLFRTRYLVSRMDVRCATIGSWLVTCTFLLKISAMPSFLLSTNVPRFKWVPFWVGFFLWWYHGDKLRAIEMFDPKCSRFRRYVLVVPATWRSISARERRTCTLVMLTIVTRLLSTNEPHTHTYKKVVMIYSIYLVSSGKKERKKP